MYSFYRQQHWARAPASGSATGVTHSPFQAAQMRLEQKRNKEQLLEEYVTANGLEHLEPTKENYDAAIRDLE